MASNQSRDRKIEYLVICPICLGYFDDPRILPCSHTYCLKCMHEAACKTDDHFTCVFRDGTTLTMEEIDDLPINRVVREIVEVLKASKLQCSECSSTVAELWCDNCEFSYCTTCYNEAHKVPARRQHQPISISEMPKKRTHCDKHPDEYLKYWCDCNKFICRDCQLTEKHRDHGCVLIEEKASKISDELKDGFNKIHLLLDATLKEYSSSNTSTTKENITALFKKLRKMLYDYERHLTHEIETIDQNNEKLVETYTKSIGEMFDQFLGEKEKYQKLISNKDDLQLIQHYPQMIYSLSQFTIQLEKSEGPKKTVYLIKGLDEIETKLRELLKTAHVIQNQPGYTKDNPSRQPTRYNVPYGIKATIRILNIPKNARWSSNGVTVAGGCLRGDGLNELNWPYTIYVADDFTVYVTDSLNHRIVSWKQNAHTGTVVAGGNGEGDALNQLNWPTGVIVDKESNNLIICDCSNRRVVRWNLHNNMMEIIIQNIDCFGIAMDDEGSIYVSDIQQHAVRKYRMGYNNATIVAGGNGPGRGLNQLNEPSYLFVDRKHSVYVSDNNNHRVVKWKKNAKEGIVVAGGNERGSSFNQLSYPNGILVDQSGTVYVADSDNNRVMRWRKGDRKGDVILGGKGKGNSANEFNYLRGLSFDRNGNFYVADEQNHRVQRFTSA